MINPKFLYLCPIDVAKANGKHFVNAHWIEVGNKVLLSGEFADEHRKNDFERNVTVQAVAHDGETVTVEHAELLAGIGVKQGHTHRQVRALAKAILPTM